MKPPSAPRSGRARGGSRRARRRRAHASVPGDHAPWSLAAAAHEVPDPVHLAAHDGRREAADGVDAGVLPEHPARERQQRVARIAMACRSCRRSDSRPPPPPSPWPRRSVRPGTRSARRATPSRRSIASREPRASSSTSIGRLLGEPGVRARVGADDHARPDHLARASPTRAARSPPPSSRRPRPRPRSPRQGGRPRTATGCAGASPPRGADHRPAGPGRAAGSERSRSSRSSRERRPGSASARWLGTAACRAGRAPAPGPCRPGR